MTFSRLIFLMLVLLMQSTIALADHSAHWKISGYGTLGLVEDDTDGAGFVRELVQPANVKNPSTIRSDTRPVLTDSRLGLQAVYIPSDSIEVMSQLVFRHQKENTLEESLEWLHVGFNIDPNLKVRLGRVGYDGFLMSDHRHLGYAYAWVRPPTEFYGAIPMYRLDGADLSYTTGLEDEVSWQFKLQAGKGGTIFPFGNGQYDYKADIWTASAVRNSGPWSMRLGFSEMAITSAPPLDTLLTQLNGLVGAISAGVDVEINNLIQNMRYDNTTLTLSSLGLSYDDGDWIMQAELGRLETESDMVSNGTMGYLAVGKRIDRFTPYLIYSQFENGSAEYKPQQNWGGASTLQTIAINTINSTRIEQKTISMGMRWDMDNNIALKFQWDHTQIEKNGYGLWWLESSAKGLDQEGNV